MDPLELRTGVISFGLSVFFDHIENLLRLFGFKDLLSLIHIVQDVSK